MSSSESPGAPEGTQVQGLPSEILLQQVWGSPAICFPPSFRRFRCYWFLDHHLSKTKFKSTGIPFIKTKSFKQNAVLKHTHNQTICKEDQIHQLSVSNTDVSKIWKGVTKNQVVRLTQIKIILKLSSFTISLIPRKHYGIGSVRPVPHRRHRLGQGTL